jgi:hypothetical protein
MCILIAKSVHIYIANIPVNVYSTHSHFYFFQELYNNSIKKACTI